MSEPDKVPKVNEKDKPFILALVSASITVLNVAFIAIGAYIGNKDMVNASVDTLKYTFTLTTAAWVFYFGKTPKE